VAEDADLLDLQLQHVPGLEPAVDLYAAAARDRAGPEVVAGPELGPSPHALHLLLNGPVRMAISSGWMSRSLRSFGMAKPKM
jgi:hypothetical protein